MSELLELPVSKSAVAGAGVCGSNISSNQPLISHLNMIGIVILR
jgi:hypothetical protein